MGPIGRPETSLRNYHSTLHKIPKERRSHVDKDFKDVFGQIPRTTTPSVDTTLIKFIFKYLQLDTMILPGLQFKRHEQKTSLSVPANPNNQHNTYPPA
jgi:hypothetical protein